MKRVLKQIAEEISQGLLQEMEERLSAELGQAAEEHPSTEDDQGTEQQSDSDQASSENVLDLLIARVAEEVSRQMGHGTTSSSKVYRQLEKKLDRLEHRLQKLTSTDQASTSKMNVDQEVLSNLKYAGPKYKDVQSVLRYIESDEDKGGLKLVIMNFND